MTRTEKPELTTRLFNPATGEFIDVDRSDDYEAAYKRQQMYKQGWKRLDRMQCRVMWDMYSCDHKRRHASHFHLIRLYELSTKGELEGKTLQWITLRIQADYEEWHSLQFYCVRQLQGTDTCVHNTEQRALYVDSRDYLKGIGYAENYQSVKGVGWLGLWERVKASAARAPSK